MWTGFAQDSIQWGPFVSTIVNLRTVWVQGRKMSQGFFSPLWLYSPILGLGRLHETFRLISVTRSRTVSRTHWTGDQLVARPLRVCPGWLWGWRSWCNERFWQGKPKYSEKTCLDATLSATNPTCQTRAGTRAAAVGSQRLTASAMARTCPRELRKFPNPDPGLFKYEVEVHVRFE
jgi:hypothetical protein